MAGSLKDALTKKGLAPPAEPKPKLEKKKWREELPDDSPPLPAFEAPATGRVVEQEKPPRKK
jgi:hypothetical protein